MKELKNYVYIGFCADLVIAVDSAEHESNSYAIADVLNFLEEYSSLDFDYVLIWSVFDCCSVCKVVF